MQLSLDVNLLNQCLNKIANSLPGFKKRPTQWHMIKAVYATLMNSEAHKPQADENGVMPSRRGESILVVEGPTGTGKSLAYLLPAVIAAKSLGKHLVVSSATVMLQEQLAYKDIPFLAQHAGLDITYAIAKGRGRYACTYKLYQHTSHATQSDFLGHDSELPPWDRKPTPQEIATLQHLAGMLHDKSWIGDRDTLTQPVPDLLWSRITNDRHGCTKRECPHFKDCPFYNARAQLETADMVIANHDLLLADLSMGGGVILPVPEDTFYCIDEAHHLADKAIKQFGASHALQGTLLWLEKLGTTVAKVEAALKESHASVKVATHAETIALTLQELSVALKALPALQPKELNIPVIYRCHQGILPKGFEEFCHILLPAMKSMLSTLNLLQETLRRRKAKVEGLADEALFDRLAVDLGFFITRVENLTAVWTLLAMHIPPEYPPIAKWIAAQWVNRGAEIEYVLSASPVSSAGVLSERLWKVAAGAILTSATLRSLGSFDKLLRDTGLSHYPQTRTIALESPFNLTEQGILNIPHMQHDPKQPDAHTREVILLLQELLKPLPGEGTLVLFTSKKQMQEVIAALPQPIVALLLVQGSQSKEALISAHFARIKANSASILFGLASFAEGLDLPGKACTHLIITKLPFAVPDDPVSQTLAEWTELRGGNAFADLTLPETSVRLIQAVGRLIRSETDYGRVSILDTRLVTMPYGRQLRKALPPFKTIIYGKEQELLM
ncbi:MAG TPA: ATP-dependent DNA helicase DinG [Gammaproteobacteria bacterium]|nr:ATP-dependent DNA helicase DinG [Gammaproteobacteria bacterium]